ncbi:MFS transporter [Parasporobacterium paucivorans]|uniref:MFS transporter, NNP family, nitrate/nitrite transporter n=1 Tax=Parasporobacterium paucivorans DSM 15970 TaxID=1122934 RepID=A0A1M6GMQ5_9FIRM|nr:MFS transporter [Parasporobacterium paucivorans]SHJ11235.1 MFS transporter, NNP family, nitrate/nitrite transporter [Parasporobacterium paucivorans DSM 15970]
MRKKNNNKGIVVFLAFIIYFIAIYPQYQLSPLSYLIIPEFKLTAVQFSGIFTAAMISGIFLSLFAGLLSDKIGIKKSISIGVIISTVAIVLRIFSNDYTTLMLSMAFAGIVSTFMNSNIAKYLGAWYSNEKLGSMAGLAMAGSSVGMAVGMSTSAFFPSVKTAFSFAAVLTGIIAAVWLVFGRDKEKEPDNGKEMSRVSIIKGLKVVVKNRQIWFIGTCLMFLMGANISVSAFLPLALQVSRGITPKAAGVVASTLMIGALAGSVLGPVICRKMGNTRMFLVICGAAGALGAAGAWLLPSGIIMIAGLFITGFLFSSMLPILISLPISIPEIGQDYAGTAGGFAATLQLLGCVLIPTYIITPIAGMNYHLLMVLAGASALASATCAFFIYRRT